MSRDPMEEDYGGYLLYEYCINDPINVIDNFGLSPSIADRISSWLQGQAPPKGCVTRSFNLEASIFGIFGEPRGTKWYVTKAIKHTASMINRFNLKLKFQICSQDCCCFTAKGVLIVEGRLVNLVDIINVSAFGEGGVSATICNGRLDKPSFDLYMCAGVKADISINAWVAGLKGSFAVKGCVSMDKGAYAIATYSGAYTQKGIFYDDTYSFAGSTCLAGNCGNPLIGGE